MKRKIILFFPLLLFLLCLFPTLARGAESSLTDDAALLTSSEQQTVTQQLKAFQTKTKMPLFIVTSSGELPSDSDEARDHVDEALADKIGYNQNGAMLWIDMTQRKIYLSTSGDVIYYFTDKHVDDTIKAVSSQLTDGHYAAGMEAFVSHAKTYYDEGLSEKNFQVDEVTGKITRYKKITVLEGALAFLIAALCTGAFLFFVKRRYSLKDTGYRYPYRQNGQLQLTEKEDRLVNSFITTRRIIRPQGKGPGGGGSTTHTSSGGGNFGGGSGGF